VVVSGVLVLTIAITLTVRAGAVLGRHRAETAADLAALAAAGGIGIDADASRMCERAAAVARANRADLIECAVQLAADGRSGDVTVAVRMAVRLAGVGVRTVGARARAGRLPG
jgi:secretion/DNA translocation related TadE-like protein